MIRKIGYLKRRIANYEKAREKVIASSRKVIKLSKQVIFELHRDGKDVSEKVKKMKSEMRRLRKKVNKRKKLKYKGIYKVAEQEYVEAMAYYYFRRKDGKIPDYKELGCDPEYYLLGICDFASELVRTATQLAIDDNLPAVEALKEVVARIHGDFLQMDLRGELRKKADRVRWSLKKMEDMIAKSKLSGR